MESERAKKTIIAETNPKKKKHPKTNEKDVSMSKTESKMIFWALNWVRSCRSLRRCAPPYELRFDWSCAEKGAS